MKKLIVDLSSWNYNELKDIADIKDITMQDLLNIIFEEEC